MVNTNLVSIKINNIPLQVPAGTRILDACRDRLRTEGQMDVAAALLSGDRMTFDALRCEAPELRQLPVATYVWFEKNYLDRDYPLRFVLKCNGVEFPETLKKEP